MKVRPRAVRDLADNVGFPEEVVLRYEAEFIKFVFAIAARERKHIKSKVKAWIHSEDVIKPDILEVIKPTEEEAPYDLI
jgi:hypothetical protein